MFNIDSLSYSFSRSVDSQKLSQEDYSTSDFNSYNKENVRYSQGEKRSRNSVVNTRTEPGCQPVTIKSLYIARKENTGIYRSDIHGCSYSVVAWILSENLSLTSKECSFHISDGTGEAYVIMDIPGDSEAWLYDRLKSIIPAESNVFQYYRIIFTMSADLHENLITLRAIHIAIAEKEDIAFYHSLLCIYAALKLNTREIEDEPENENKPFDLDNITLDPSLSSRTDPYELAILKYITKNRVPLYGIPKGEIFSGVSSLGYDNVDELNKAMDKLIDDYALFQNPNKNIDLLLEDE